MLGAELDQVHVPPALPVVLPAADASIRLGWQTSNSLERSDVSVLRDDDINYSDYVTELVLLLFVKSNPMLCAGFEKNETSCSKPK